MKFGVRQLNMKLPLTLVFATLALSSCNRFNGDISFVNASDRHIVVDKAIGFERQPPCGILITGAHASANMRSMPYPSEIAIVWWYARTLEDPWNHHNNVQTNTIDLRGINPSRESNRELRFTFTHQYTWQVSNINWTTEQ